MISYGRPIAQYVPESDAVLPFTCREIANVNVRILGAEPLWGGNIKASGLSVPQLQEILNETGKITGLRLAGYIMDEGSGVLRYHMARLPRRINVPIPDLEVFQRAFAAASSNLKNHGVESVASEEGPSKGELLRVLIGLEEGYFESRRKDLIRQIDSDTFTDLSQLKDAFLLRIGDPSKWGVNLEGATSISEAREAIAAKSMSKLHTLEEVRAILSGDFTVTPALIHSVAPDYVYIEPAVEIVAPRTHANFEALTLLAAQFHQARFSLEHLDTMEAFNVEIIEDSCNNAARFS